MPRPQLKFILLVLFAGSCFARGEYMGLTQFKTAIASGQHMALLDQLEKAPLVLDETAESFQIEVSETAHALDEGQARYSDTLSTWALLRLQFGNELARLGKYNEAASVATPIKDYPYSKNHDLALLKAECLIRLENKDEALACLRSVMHKRKTIADAKNSEVNFRAVELLLETEKLKEAIDQSEKGALLIRKKKALARYYLQLGKLFSEYDFTMRNQFLEKGAFLGQSRASIEALDLLAQHAFEQRQFEKVRQYRERLMNVPDRPFQDRVHDLALYIWCQHHVQGGLNQRDIEQVKEYADRAEELNNATALFALAKAFLSIDDLSTATQLYMKVTRLTLQDSTKWAYLKLAQISDRQGEYKAAMEFFVNHIEQCLNEEDYAAAVKGLVQLLQSTSAQKLSPDQMPNDLIKVAKESVGKMENVEGLLWLHPFFRNNGREDLAALSLQQAMQVADERDLDELRSVPQKLREEHALMRKLFQQRWYDKLIERAEDLTPDVLERDGVRLNDYAMVKVHYIAGLLHFGRFNEADQVRQEILELAKEDPETFARAALYIGEKYETKDRRLLYSLMEQAVTQGGDSFPAAKARLWLISRDVGLLNITSATGHLEVLNARLRHDDEDAGERKAYWTAEYLKGVLLQGQGDAAGVKMKEEARRHKVYAFAKKAEKQFKLRSRAQRGKEK